MKNDLRRSARREARVWAVAAVVVAIWLIALWTGA